jgi:hypothetical protein
MTQKEEILDYIKTYGSITPMEAWNELLITKLATRVSEMRKKGMEFKIEYIKKKNIYGRTVRYARYSLGGNE